jgi:hypothetical protein
MPLTREQFDSLYNSGVSVDQISAFEQGLKPRDLESREPTGLIQSFSQAVAKPFLKMGASIQDIVVQGKSIAAQLTGDKKKEAELEAKLANDRKRGVDFGYLGRVTPLGQTGSAMGDLKESLGVGAEIGSYAIGGGGTAKAIATGLKGKILRGAFTGATTGAASGGLATFGQAMQEAESQPADIALRTVLGAGLGAGTGLILGAATPVVVKGLKGVQTYTNLGRLEEKFYNVNRDVLKPSSIQLAEWTQKKVDPIKTFTQEFGAEYIPTSGDKLVLDDLIAQVDTRYRAGSEGFNAILRNSPEVVSISKGQSQALSAIESSSLTPSQKLSAKAKIDAEFNALRDEAKKGGYLLGEDNVPVAYADNIKDRFWGATRNFGTEESTVANAVNRNIGFAFKDGIEEVVTDVNVRAYNKKLQELIVLRDFLESRNGKVPGTGGKFTRRTLSIAGSVAGSSGGPVGSVVGALTADNLAKALISPEARTWLIRKQLQRLSPEARKSLQQEAEIILQNMSKKRQEVLRLPAGNTGGGKFPVTPNVINAPAPGTIEPGVPRTEVQNAALPPLSSEPKLLKGGGQNPIELAPQKLNTQGGMSPVGVVGAAAGVAGAAAAALNPKKVEFINGEQPAPVVSKGDNVIEPKTLGSVLMELESSGGRNKANADEGEMKWLTGLTELAIAELKRKGIKEKVDVNDKEDVLDASVKYFELMQSRYPDKTPGEIYVDYYWTQAKNKEQRQKKIDEFNKLVEKLR